MVLGGQLGALDRPADEVEIDRHAPVLYERVEVRGSDSFHANSVLSPVPKSSPQLHRDTAE